MKAVAVSALLLAVPCLGQLTEAERHGGSLGGLPTIKQPLASARKLPPQADDFRVVNGQLYNIQRSKLWVTLSGEAVSSEGAITIMDVGARYTRWVAVKNLKDDRAVHGKTVSFKAMKTGQYKWNDIPVELYDCGTKPKPTTAKPPARTNTVIPTATRPKATITNSPAAKSPASGDSK